MNKKLLGDFRQLNLTQLTPEVRQLHERFNEKVSLLREKNDQMKEAVILQAAGMTAPEAREQKHRFQMAFTADGVEHVFMDGEPLVDFMPGRIEDGHWKAPYRLYHRGNRP